jgi:hypothetical protein
MEPLAQRAQLRDPCAGAPFQQKGGHTVLDDIGGEQYSLRRQVQHRHALRLTPAHLGRYDRHAVNLDWLVVGENMGREPDTGRKVVPDYFVACLYQTPSIRLDARACLSRPIDRHVRALWREHADSAEMIRVGMGEEDSDDRFAGCFYLPKRLAGFRKFALSVDHNHAAIGFDPPSVDRAESGFGVAANLDRHGPVLS